MEIESLVLYSGFLKRDVVVDIYVAGKPETQHQNSHLLFINDGQDLVKMGFDKILLDLSDNELIHPLICVGIHCGADRENEYGVAEQPDFKGRGSKAHLYERFIFKELMPVVNDRLSSAGFMTMGFCGFSLGGLSALDLVWRNPQVFVRAGLFSGSFWWRSLSQDDAAFDEDKHRIMHQRIREGNYVRGLKFFFETGTHDETADRNNNGIIDSIDDTLSLIKELHLKGYAPDDIRYLELEDGSHDVPTWGRAFPFFLEWVYGKREAVVDESRV